MLVGNKDWYSHRTDMQKCIHFLHLIPKPIFSNTIRRSFLVSWLLTYQKKKKNFQSTWSYAFSISIFQTKPTFELLLLESTTSFVMRATSRICLPLTNAFRFFDTTFPITLFSLLAKTFGRSLYRLPTRLISLNP